MSRGSTHDEANYKRINSVVLLSSEEMKLVAPAAEEAP